MGRSRYNVFASSHAKRYLVIWDLQWQLIECRTLACECDLPAEFAAFMRQLRRDGWAAQSSGEFGFTFVTRGAERRLVILTARNPHDSNRQSFSPFRTNGFGLE